MTFCVVCILQQASIFILPGKPLRTTYLKVKIFVLLCVRSGWRSRPLLMSVFYFMHPILERSCGADPLLLKVLHTFLCAVPNDHIISEPPHRLHSAQLSPVQLGNCVGILQAPCHTVRICEKKGSRFFSGCDKIVRNPALQPVRNEGYMTCELARCTIFGGKGPREPR